MTQLEAMKLALDALGSITFLNSFNDGDYLTCNFKTVEEAIAALRQAIEQAQKQESGVD